MPPSLSLDAMLELISTIFGSQAITIYQVLLIVEADATAGLTRMTIGDDITMNVKLNIRTNITPMGRFLIALVLTFVNPSYLQLETLVTSISHRFRPEDSKHPFV
jgi:hypothetical protein